MRIIRMIPLAAAAGAAVVMLISGSSMAAISHSPPAGHHSRLKPVSKPALDSEPGSCSGESGGPWVCIYADASYDLGPGIFKQTNSDWGSDLGSSKGVCVAGKTAASDNRGGWNDCVSSIWNGASTNTYTMYINNGCANGGGDKLTIAAGTGVSDLNNDTAPNGDSSYWNDSLSSDIVGGGGDC
jgi:hypothetical protein